MCLASSSVQNSLTRIKFEAIFGTYFVLITEWQRPVCVMLQRLGLEPKLLAKILNMSTGRCWSSESYNPCPGVIMGIPSSNDYKGGFATGLMTKVGCS